jgi:hypothetical protein
VSEQYRKLAREVEQRILAHRATLGREDVKVRPVLAPAPAPAPQGVIANA